MSKMTSNTPRLSSSASKKAQRTSRGGRFLGALTRGPYRKFSGSHPPSSFISKGLAFPFLALLAALAVGLLVMLPGGPVQAQDSDPIEINYPENDTMAVATFTAVDPEGAMVRWSLSGGDMDAFMIEGGVLSFEEPPNYEEKRTYSVTVKATDETMMDAEQMVMVKITNEEEPGMVKLSALGPQAGTELTATLTDPDALTDAEITGHEWQWSRSRSRNGSYSAIDKADMAAYEPVGADAGYYLMATVMYDDPEGDGKTEMMKSAHMVQAIPSPNNGPEFDDDDDTTNGNQTDREVVENTPKGRNVGAPVAAKHEDGHVLTYTLRGVDAASFEIDPASGQIMTNEKMKDYDADENDRKYIVIVRATDPGAVPAAPAPDTLVITTGTMDYDEVEVTITVTGVNEGPAITTNAAPDDMFAFDEVDGVIGTALATFEATDPEGNTLVSWMAEGPDGGRFTVTAGALKFKVKPDHEMPSDANSDNTYEVTVVAEDDLSNRSTKDVRVTVDNIEEDGVVTLSRAVLRDGLQVKAMLRDPDGSVSRLTWEWKKVTGGDEVVLSKSDTYTPEADDVDEMLTVTARYTDRLGSGKSMEFVSPVVESDTRNKAPVFEDQDDQTDGVQNEMAMREVDESAKAVPTDDGADTDDMDDMVDNVGLPVMAEDAKADGTVAVLIYSLGGADAGLFRVRDNGQIEVAAGTELNYEMRQTYMVTVMAEDSFGASASIPVTIMVTDIDEKPEITGDDSINYPENDTMAVATFTAVDPEGAMVRWSLSGGDMDAFMIEGGVLSFEEPPNYEEKRTYSVTVKATDETMMDAEQMVMVKITNEEEPGMVKLSALGPQAGTELTATLTDPDALTDAEITGHEWQWSRSRSRNGSYSAIDKADMAAYEPVGADAGYYLMATVMYDDPEGDGKTEMMKSAHMVQAIPSPNNGPEFDDDDDTTNGNQTDREVVENTPKGRNVGAPVAAKHEDGHVLTYTLRGVDAASFEIDPASGQIMTNEKMKDYDADENDRKYIVIVRATDPGAVPAAPAPDTLVITTGTMDYDEVEVTITVTGVNEGPAITTNAAPDDMFAFDEVDGVIGTALATFEATDPEGNTLVSWMAEGPDGGRFTVTAGALKFKVKPDHEMPSDANSDNTYEVTVVAEDDLSNRSTKDVRVTVDNIEEDGVVTLSRAVLRDGLQVKAMLRDPDGSVSRLTWEWKKVTGGDEVVLSKSDTYTPEADDVDEMLTVTARYTDRLGSGKSMEFVSPVVESDTRNKAPVFEDQDDQTDGVQNEMAMREVDESAKAVPTDDGADTDDMDDMVDNVGLPVMAEDAKADGTVAVLIYSLGGADAGLFRVRDNGQIEVAAGTELNYEMRQTYMVTVMAEDSFGASASIPVTIMVTDIDEKPEIMLGGLAISGMSSVSRMEGSGTQVATYMAVGPEAASTIWSLSGDDMGDFEISRTGGVLTFRSSPDYENPTDMNMDNVYMVTIMADDGTYMDTHDVMVMVTMVGVVVDEPGMVTLWAGTVALTMAPQVGDTITGLVVDPDLGVTGEMWQWSRTKDTANMSSWMPITGATDAVYTVTADDEGYYLRVLATYTDAVGTDMDMADSMPTMMVGAMAAEMTLLERYDDGDDGWIQLDEARVAVGDYFSPPKGSKLSLADTRKVVGLYFDYKNRQQ